MLSRALECALGQRDVDLEVIVVDDGSVDRTREMLGGLVDDRLRVLRNDASAGVASARNQAAAEARGTWIAFLDDDDLWAPNKLAAQLAATEENGMIFVYTAAAVVDERLRPIRVLRPPPPHELRERLLRSNPIGGPSAVLVRADAFAASGGFDPTLSILEDWDLWLRLEAAGRAALCPDVLTAFVHHRGSSQVRNVAALVADFERLRAKHEKRGLDGTVFRRSLAVAHLRREGRAAGAHALLRNAARHRSPRDLLRLPAVAMGERATGRIADVIRRTGPPPAWLEKFR